MFSELIPVVSALTAALHERDNYTRFHSDRVLILSTSLAKACGISSREIEILRVAALFHDIGKIGVPDHVLLKPGPLTEEEWVLMRAHPTQGERIILATALPVAAEVARIVRHHHEAYDGSGYPDRLQSEEIPLLSRILSVADCYDAMATTRPYRTAMHHSAILEILLGDCDKKLDEMLVKQFIQIIGNKGHRDLLAA